MVRYIRASKDKIEAKVSENDYSESQSEKW